MMQSAHPNNRTTEQRRVDTGRVGSWLSSLAGRLVLFAISLVSVTVLLIGTLSYGRARRALESDAHTALSLIARDIASNLGLEISDTFSEIKNWSHLEVMRAILYMDVDKQLAEFVRQVSEGRGTFRAMVVFDRAGHVVAGEGAIPYAERRGRVRKARLAVVEGADGGATPVFTIEVPVPHPENERDVIGSVLVVADPAAMLAKLTATALKPGRDLAVALQDAQGAMIATSGPLVGSPASGDDPNRRISGRSRVPSLSDVDLPPLEITVSDTVASALAPVMALRREVVRLGLLALLAGCVLGAIVAWRIGRPIRQLTAEVTRISESGNLDAAIRIGDARGEVGVLLSAFREMLGSLSDAQAQAVAQSRLALLGEIAANVAHEVRTPLSVMKTSAQLLARGGTPPHERDRLVRMIGDEVDRLNAVVTDLVDIARPKSVVYAAEPLVPIVLRAAALCDAFAQRSGVEIKTEVLDENLRVRCCADQIYQVILNLLRNALQAIERGGEITLRMRRQGHWAAIEIDDTGPGFSPDALEKAFSPFFTTKESGAGLGLAIAARIVEEHGGTIAAGNLPGGGARLSLRFSIAEA